MSNNSASWNTGIDAAFSFKTKGKNYFFKGNQYSRLEDTKVDLGYPRSLPGGWSGLPASWYSGIDAALYHAPIGKSYFFKGNHYIRLTGTKVDSGYPRALPGGWSGLPPAFTTGIDAALFYEPTGKVYFFKGNQYVRLTGTVVDSGYPRTLPGGWSGLPPAFTTGIDAAIFRKGHTYFFKVNQYARFTGTNLDQGYPRRLPGGWAFEDIPPDDGPQTVALRASVRTPGPAFFLPSGSFEELEFSPLAREIVVTAFSYSDLSDPSIGRWHPQDEFDTLAVDVEEGIEVKLFRPGVQNPVASMVTKGTSLLELVETLRYPVPENQAGGTWRCRFTNTTNTGLYLEGVVGYASEMRQLQTTRIPFRTLNHALRNFLSLLELQIQLDGSNSYIDFSPVIKKHTDLEQIRFDLFDEVQDINMSYSRVWVFQNPNSGMPVVRIAIGFEEEGAEIEHGVGSADLSNLRIVCDLELLTAMKGMLYPRVSVLADIHIDLPSLADILLASVGASAHDVAKVINKKLREAFMGYLGSGTARKELGDYLEVGLLELAQRGHHFYGIAADNQSIILKHYNPEPPSGGQIPGSLQTMDVLNNQDPVALANLDKIDHIVVLMQENRSFDHILGYLSHPDHGGRNDVDGLTGGESNYYHGLGNIKVFPLSKTGGIPSPSHDYDSVIEQIADGAMSGFLKDFRQRYPDWTHPEDVMGYHTAEQVPTFHFFSENYMICDRWFCSFPGATFPNRFCYFSGRTPVKTNGEVLEDVGYIKWPSIFDHLTEASIEWMFYEQSATMLRFYDKYRLDDRHIIPFDDPVDGFKAKLENGGLPPVTFIAPRYYETVSLSEANDDHLPVDISAGQDNIACIYDMLVNSSQWSKTLFIITYDEHGGLYDHVPPPGTAEWDNRVSQGIESDVDVDKVHPDPGNVDPALFGVRVPTFVISPYVPKREVSKNVFDQTSIIKTILVKFWGTTFPAMGRRVRHAAHLGHLLTEDVARSDTPMIGAECIPKHYPLPDGFEPPTKPSPDDFHETMGRFGRPQQYL